MVLVRTATAADAKGILDIYGPFISDSAITFEAELPSIPSFAARIEKYLLERPWIVCEINGTIAGYVYAGSYRERAAYQWCCESSVYIHPDFKGHGLGQQLYSILMPILELQGYRNVYAVITLPNPASVRLHEHMGFKHFADYENVGFKLGAWQKVGWWRLPLNEFNDHPTPPIPFPQLDPLLYTNLYKNAATAIEKSLTA